MLCRPDAAPGIPLCPSACVGRLSGRGPRAGGGRAGGHGDPVFVYEVRQGPPLSGAPVSHGGATPCNTTPLGVSGRPAYKGRRPLRPARPSLAPLDRGSTAFGDEAGGLPRRAAGRLGRPPRSQRRPPVRPSRGPPTPAANAPHEPAAGVRRRPSVHRPTLPSRPRPPVDASPLAPPGPRRRPEAGRCGLCTSARMHESIIVRSFMLAADLRVGIGSSPEPLMKIRVLPPSMMHTSFGGHRLLGPLPSGPRSMLKGLACFSHCAPPGARSGVKVWARSRLCASGDFTRLPLF